MGPTILGWGGGIFTRRKFEVAGSHCNFLKFCLGTPERGAGGSRRPSCLSVGGAGGAKVPFLNAMICFLIVDMIQQRSYKQRRMPSISGIYLLA